MATYTLAWKIPWIEEPANCSPQGYKESDRTRMTKQVILLLVISL